jgi:hypothetical protein
LKFPKLLGYLESTLHDALQNDTALAILVLADKYEMISLKTATIEFVVKDQEKFTKEIEWNEFFQQHSKLFNEIFKNWLQNSKLLLTFPTGIKKELRKVNSSNSKSNSNICKLYTNMKHPDLTIMINGKELKAHKGILSC